MQQRNKVSKMNKFLKDRSDSGSDNYCHSFDRIVAESLQAVSVRLAQIFILKAILLALGENPLQKNSNSYLLSTYSLNTRICLTRVFSWLCLTKKFHRARLRSELID